MLLIHDILHCKEMSKMKDVDQIFDALGKVRTSS